ncbi:hypothetical protein IEQ34_004358 [Dendrobium chrysotoxum]|uniref:Uncharacterized protein n=1 Tax=Dendrobium chrysotoxum TaxID=161865 RepID=A0AAV7HI47_DENCH|nr:hypothetical protein IEQ34_004358 [Dendrobium chrysotoxum]
MPHPVPIAPIQLLEPKATAGIIPGQCLDGGHVYQTVIVPGGTLVSIENDPKSFHMEGTTRDVGSQTGGPTTAGLGLALNGPNGSTGLTWSTRLTQGLGMGLTGLIGYLESSEVYWLAKLSLKYPRKGLFFSAPVASIAIVCPIRHDDVGGNVGDNFASPSLHLTAAPGSRSCYAATLADLQQGLRCMGSTDLDKTYFAVINS